MTKRIYFENDSPEAAQERLTNRQKAKLAAMSKAELMSTLIKSMYSTSTPGSMPIALVVMEIDRRLA